MTGRLLVPVVFILLYTDVSARVIVANITTINNLSNIISSHDRILLDGGVHNLSTSFVLHNLTNISIYGSIVKDSIVSCAPGVGIAMFNVHTLVIYNVTFLHCGAQANGTGFLRGASSFSPATIPSDIIIGLIVAESKDLVLSRVTIDGTSGLGMLVMNVMGSVSITYSDFVNNKSPRCYHLLQNSTSHKKYVGGGLTFIYEDRTRRDVDFHNSSVYVVSSSFRNNQGCTNNVIVGLYNQYSLELQKLGYIIGEGGLTLISSQLEYGLQFNVLHCKFTGNAGRYGSALTVMVFSGVRNTAVYVINSMFSKNGFYLETDDHIKDYLFAGGAIGVAVNFFRPQEFVEFPCTENHRNVMINIIGCSLENNKAFAGGGIIIRLHHQTCTTSDIPVVNIVGCTFSGNIAMLGAAMYVDDTRKHGADLGSYILLSDTEIVDSHLEQDDYQYSVRDTSAAVVLLSTSLVVTELVTIANTGGTGLEAQGALIIVQGTLMIADNVGVYGGGMKLVDLSAVLMMEHSDLTIINNTAILYGGGIYVDFLKGSPTIIDADCFLYFGLIDIYCKLGDCVDFETFNAHLEITNNSAKQGEIVYGSTLETCPWAKSQNVFRMLNESFLFDHKKDNSFNTRPRTINITDNLTLFRKMPGQKFELTMRAVDRFNNSVPVLVTVGTLRLDSAKLGNMGYYFLDGNSSNVVPITVYGEEGETVNLTIYMTESYKSSASLTVELQRCVAGFRYNDELNVCECIPELMEHSIQCFIDNVSILVPDGTWIGPLNGFEYITENLVVHDCLLNFCQTGSSILVVNGSFNSQCKEGSNRDGLLCGGCAKGHSLPLGGFECLKCSNYNLFFLLYFLLMGIVFVATLALLDINLSTGFLNGFIFFEHIGHIYSYHLIPYMNGQPFQPFELLNSNCAVAICFFDGMRELDRTIFSFSYPIYLLGIIFAIYYAAKKITVVSKMGFAITKTFATLVIVLYVLVAETCVRVLGFVQLTTLSGRKVLRWRYDPEVEYFTGVHAATIVVSIVILTIYVIPLPFLLLCPEKLYKMKCTNHLKPFFDAIWNPFKPQYRYWLGLRLLLRMLLFLFATLLPSPLNIFLTLTFLFLLATIQVRVKPFQGKWQNFTDILFLSILILLFMTTLFFFQEGGDANLAHYVTGIVIAITAYVIMVPIITYHLFLKYPKLKQPFVKLSQKCLLFRLILHKIWPEEISRDSKLSLPHRSQTLSPVANTLVTPSLKTAVSTSIFDDIDEEFRGAGLEATIVTHTVYREPLLDEGELEIEASYSSRILRATSNSISSIDMGSTSDK